LTAALSSWPINELGVDGGEKTAAMCDHRLFAGCSVGSFPSQLPSSSRASRGRAGASTKDVVFGQVPTLCSILLLSLTTQMHCSVARDSHHMFAVCNFASIASRKDNKWPGKQMAGQCKHQTDLWIQFALATCVCASRTGTPELNQSRGAQLN